MGRLISPVGCWPGSRKLEKMSRHPVIFMIIKLFIDNTHEPSEKSSP
jgi:hypothetical protein